MDEHDPLLTQAYREAAHPEPGSALDARILAQARQAVTAAPRRHGGWRRWMAPASGMAVLVLAATLVVTMWREQPEQIAPAPLPETTSHAETSAAPANAPPEAAPSGAERFGPAPPTRARADRAGAAQANSASVPSAAGAAPAAGSAAIPAPVPAAAEAARAQPVAPPTARMDGEPAATRAMPALPSAADAMAGVPAPAKAMASRQAGEATQTEAEPDRDIARIRDLMHVGRIEAARRALDAFVRRYPNYELPQDLRPLRDPH